MTALHKSSGGCVDAVDLASNGSVVTRVSGYNHNGSVACMLQDTGNGYIVRFLATTSVEQDYYVCLEYSQAYDLVLALSAFKADLGFIDKSKKRGEDAA
jgi:hypothetical protein